MTITQTILNSMNKVDFIRSEKKMSNVISFLSTDRNCACQSIEMLLQTPYGANTCSYLTLNSSNRLTVLTRLFYPIINQDVSLGRQFCLRKENERKQQQKKPRQSFDLDSFTYIQSKPKIRGKSSKKWIDRKKQTIFHFLLHTNTHTRIS